jgi:hypothetical protein
MVQSRIRWFAAVSTLVALVACAGGGVAAPTGTAAEIIDKVFATANVEPFGMSQSLATDEDIAFYLGSTDYPPFAEAVAAMPMISIDTRVLVILKAAESGDVEAIKAGLKENIDPNRVICVTFAPEDVAIESRDDVIMMTINTDAAQRAALVEAFQGIE